MEEKDKSKIQIDNDFRHMLPDGEYTLKFTTISEGWSNSHLLKEHKVNSSDWGKMFEKKCEELREMLNNEIDGRKNLPD